VRVGGLGVVDEPDPSGLGHHGPAVRQRGEGAQGRPHRLGVQPEGQRRRRRGGSIRQVGRGLRRWTSQDLGLSQARHQVPVPVSDLAGSRLVQGEPRRLARSRPRDLGGVGVVPVAHVDVVPRLQLVNAGLGRAVRLEGSVPVEVIGRQVQEDRDPRAERAVETELERGGLYGQGLVAFDRGQGERIADVAAGDGVQTRLAHRRRHHLRGGGLAVRPRHAHVGAFGQPGAQLQLAPHRDPSAPDLAKDLRTFGDSGAGHDQVRPVEVLGPVTSGQDLDAGLFRLPGPLLHVLARPGLGDPHPGAPVPQHLGRGHPAGRQPDDHHLLPAHLVHVTPPRARKSA
jgi:hypothetical protein